MWKRARPADAGLCPMARPGLEPGTPRFSEGDRSYVFRTRSPANQADLDRVPLSAICPQFAVVPTAFAPRAVSRGRNAPRGNASKEPIRRSRMAETCSSSAGYRGRARRRVFHGARTESLCCSYAPMAPWSNRIGSQRSVVSWTHAARLTGCSPYGCSASTRWCCRSTTLSQPVWHSRTDKRRRRQA